MKYGDLTTAEAGKIVHVAFPSVQRKRFHSGTSYFYQPLEKVCCKDKDDGLTYAGYQEGDLKDQLKARTFQMEEHKKEIEDLRVCLETKEEENRKEIQDLQGKLNALTDDLKVKKKNEERVAAQLKTQKEKRLEEVSSLKRQLHAVSRENSHMKEKIMRNMGPQQQTNEQSNINIPVIGEDQFQDEINIPLGSGTFTHSSNSRVAPLLPHPTQLGEVSDLVQSHYITRSSPPVDRNEPVKRRI